MAVRATSVNPDILRWARERARLSHEDVAKSLKKKPDDIFSWEKGESFPTLVQLEKLAEKLYKRPLALFFFPEPPEEEDAATMFRTLPDFDLDKLSSDTVLATREALAMQLTLKEITEGRNPADRLIFRDLSFSSTDSPEDAARRTRVQLGIEISKQLEWKKSDKAFKEWRLAVEDHGVFVFKRAFKQAEISGFCLADEELPIIFINNSTPHTRQSFTLFHELAHLLLGISSLTVTSYPFSPHLFSSDSVEVWCNKFASSLLVPSGDFRAAIRSYRRPVKEIERLAGRYCVSRQVVLRRLVDEEIIGIREYQERAKKLNENFRDRSPRESSGGSYYANQATYLGDTFLRLAFTAYNDGRVSLQALAGYLNMKAKNVERLQDFLLQRL